MLRAGTLDTTAARRALEVIERNAYSQNQLVTDLLDVSRIITGTMTLETATVHLASIVDAALEAVRPAADTKNIMITRTLAADVGPIVADAGRIQQVVWNLLANAVKFTPSGGRIDVKLACIGTSAQLVVRDTGKGISKEFLPHLFERFRQADSSTTRAYGGLGLGLAIVRHLVELHSGTVTAKATAKERDRRSPSRFRPAAPRSSPSFRSSGCQRQARCRRPPARWRAYVS
jgi:signal transduction histidine kinase